MSKLSLTNSEFLSFRPKYTSDLSKLQRYVGAAVDWEATHGLLFKAPKPSCDQSSNSSSKEGWMESALIPAPVSFAPSPIPRQEFEKVVALQPTLNQLFDKVSKDHEFLISTLNSLGSADEFTSRIFTMYVQLHSLGVKKPAVIGIHRSDYLIHAPDNEPDASPKAKQVEFNTIASSFASLSSIVGNFHRYMLGRTGYKGLLEDGDILKDQLPENESLTSIGDALASGFKLYGNKDAVIVMVVQPGERNVYDQRWIETRLWERHNIAVVRMTFAEINDKCATDSESRLFIDGKEIAIAYYRSGYAPTDFPTEKEWDGRWMIEKSRAISVPNLAYHLAGCKKVQQVLAQPGVVERFLGDADKAAFVRGCFVGLYPLDESAEGIKAYQDAISNPANYVVKPQREGGGYNTYGNDIPSLLKGLSEEERKAYILMDLIRAPGFKNVLLREGKLIAGEVVSELGIYGIWVSDANDNVVVNRHGGHLLRTKASDVYEGGVAAGFAVIDSPLLV
ncbi:Glutathione synthetase [Coemansia spiralis]|uniref:Glutathione synthetase n=1 Tax=Coemansia spiralis TaxID=417178 RepID=A0A9W8G232_9FUNG|nr:Glutathione synthetase [Coemansia sp. RSA 1358]KAJ2676764.1 Glutathione synthetase [Coemansia spiralis]